jgi:hypothetical protein
MFWVKGIAQNVNFSVQKLGCDFNARPQVGYWSGG